MNIEVGSNHNEQEEVLTGGNVSAVYRKGSTVRRDVKPNSFRIHKLLTYLENKDFNFAPKFLGVDEKNREVLSFIEGEAGNYPLKTYMWHDDTLKEIAKTLRLYHDAVSDFSFSEDWKPIDKTPNYLEVLCHNDFAIYNIIFNNQKPVGIIDFDLAAPGPRLWDIVYTLYTCVPLSRHYHNEEAETNHYEAEKDANRIKQRIELFFEAYDVPGIEKNYLETVVLRLEGLCAYMKRKAEEGDTAFQQMIKQGHFDHYQEDIAFIRKYGKDWL
ncbi:phosphotransferase [Priestia flexa]|uniref:phosphotransferase n=1 Tax=Priestia flexa TaxID=86664 RepID=UPI000970D061|nr:phosphotransferase [Priestia flexa]MBY6086477.1 phosphotransferase [Priestia flexa]